MALSADDMTAAESAPRPAKHKPEVSIKLELHTLTWAYTSHDMHMTRILNTEHHQFSK